MTGNLFVRAHMQLQYGLRVAESRAVVLHPDVQSVRFTPYAHDDPMSCPLRRVVHDVAEHLESIAFVDSPIELRRAVDGEGQARSGMDLFQGIANPIQDRRHAQVRRKASRAADS